MADGLGFEPRQADPESAVLPLHYPSTLRSKVDAEVTLKNATLWKRFSYRGATTFTFYLCFHIILYISFKNF